MEKDYFCIHKQIELTTEEKNSILQIIQTERLKRMKEQPEEKIIRKTDLKSINVWLLNIMDRLTH